MARIGRTSSDSSATKLYFRCNSEIDRLKHELKSLWNAFASEYDKNDVMTQMFLQEVALNLGFEDFESLVKGENYIGIFDVFSRKCKSRKDCLLRSMMKKAFDKVFSISFILEKKQLFSDMNTNMRIEISNAIRNHHPNWEQEIMEESYDHPRLFMLESELNENINTSKARISVVSPYVLFTWNSSTEVQNAVLEAFHIPYDDVRKMAVMVNLIPHFFNEMEFIYKRIPLFQ